ncbi:MAG: hypothetical protein ACK55I_49395, partial [bacterium]
RDAGKLGLAGHVQQAGHGVHRSGAPPGAGHGRAFPARGPRHGHRAGPGDPGLPGRRLYH